MEKLIKLTPNDETFKDLYLYPNEVEFTKIFGSFKWSGKKINRVDLSIETKPKKTEIFHSGNFCCANCKYEHRNIYVLELHFFTSSLPHIKEAIINVNCDVEINENSIIIVNRMLYDKPGDIKTCVPSSSGASFQPKVKKGNILIGN